MPQNKTNHHKPNTNTLILVSLIPNPTHEMRAAVSHLKNLATTRKTHMRRQKTCHHQVPIANPTFDHSPHQKTVVRPWASGVTNFHDVTGGVYKARERIHRSIADLRLLATPTSWGRVADPNPN